MNKKIYTLLLTLLLVGIGSANLAQAQVRSNRRVSDRQIRTVLTRIEQRTNIFKSDISAGLGRNALTGGDTEQMLNDYVADFESATDSFKQNLNSRRASSADVEDVLNRATNVHQFVQRNRLSAVARRDWNNIRVDLNTLASYYRVSWNPNTPVTPGPVNGGGTMPYRVSDRDVQALLSSIETRTDSYKRELSYALDRSALNNTRSEDAVMEYVKDFETATDKLKSNFDSRRSAAADVEEVLSRAYYIDRFMRDYRLTTSSETQWRSIRTDLDKLANYYNVNFSFDTRQYQPASKFDEMLTGTYRLNVSRSDNVQEVVDRSVGSYNVNQRDRVKSNLERRLNSPEMLVIEKRNAQVTIASSISPQVSFDADGTTRTETTNNGRAIKITAATSYDGVSLNYEGDRINDFYVNFSPLNNGQLRVVRRVYLENKNETVTVASLYDKVSDRADYTMINNQNDNTGGNLYNEFIIPNNTRLTAVTRSTISTKVSQNGDRFQMEITSPSEYNGAIIEGRITKTERSGRVSGRANVALEFDTVKLRNGRTYKFAGIVEEVRLASGEKVTVNNEGTVRDNNQTTKTVTRAGIGAAIGAIIGAIAGGGQGAVIGAGVGAGAGAGSVILQGRDDVEIDPGSEITLTATAPNNIGNPR